MANLFQRMGEFLTRQLTRGASPAGRVVYVRKVGGAEIDLTGLCWVGRTPTSRLPADASPALVYTVRDYLVPVAALHGPPERGDRFEEDLAGTEPQIWEVVSVLDQPEWVYADPGQNVYRVHTTRVV